jgi:hypothetical protein
MQSSVRGMRALGLALAALLTVAVPAAATRAAQPSGTMTIGPATLATSDLQNHPTCGSAGCTYIQWSGSAADATYASPVDGTIVAWRITSGSAGNKVTLRILRPAGGGKFSAVASSDTETTTGSTTAPDQFSTNLPVKAGDIIGLDNASSALIFKTGVLGSFPELWTPPVADGSPASAPTPPPGTLSNGYQLQIDAYVQPSPKTTTTTTTATTPTTTTTTTAAPVPTSLELTGVSLKAAWTNSRLSARLRFSVTVKGASHFVAEIRPATGGGFRSKRGYTTTRGGTFAEQLGLPAATPPGDYRLQVVATTGSSTPASRVQSFTLKAPPQGIVDAAAISTSRGGKAATTVQGPVKELWVRLHFLAPPKAGKVKIVWRTPGFKSVGEVVKAYATTMDSSLRGSAPLARGRWYAVVSVNGTIVKRLGVRVE